jgi:sporulation protein YlmC with PRC-barrel domain
VIHASSLEGRIIRTERGRRLGRLHDLRFVTQGAQAEITHVIYGRRGLLERFGFRGERFDTIAWPDVIDIRPNEIVVTER